MPELYELGALELVRHVRAREVSRRQVLEAHLDRIDAVNGLVNAVVERVDRDDSARGGRGGGPGPRGADGTAARRRSGLDQGSLRRRGDAAHGGGPRVCRPAVSRQFGGGSAAARRGRVRRRQVQPAGLPDPLEHGQRPLRRHPKSPRHEPHGRRLVGWRRGGRCERDGRSRPRRRLRRARFACPRASAASSASVHRRAACPTSRRSIPSRAG